MTPRFAPLNLCRCGNHPEIRVLTNGLMRISCVLGKCDEIICARPHIAGQAWNDINPQPSPEVTEVECVIPLVWDEDEATQPQQSRDRW